MAALEELGGPAWFRLGDRDLATHLERTRRLAAGEALSDVTGDLCARLRIAHRIVPVSDTPVSTIVETDEGDLPFQDYFVKRKCEPAVSGFRFAGAADASLSQPLREVMENGSLDCVVVCPSNPFVSIDPMLAIPGMKALLGGDIPVVAVSPIVGGKTIKGPAAKMMGELGVEPSVHTIAHHYRDIVDGLVIDVADHALTDSIRKEGFTVLVTDTVMQTDAVRKALATETLAFAQEFRG